MIQAIRWEDDGVVLLDQRQLPAKEIHRRYSTVESLADAIRTLVVRGAPAIGITAAMGVAMGFQKLRNSPNPDRDFDRICSLLQNTRPTARNLFWAIERMQHSYRACKDGCFEDISHRLIDEALAIQQEDLEVNIRIGRIGQSLLPDPVAVLTYCNTGALATGGYGTALGIIRAAVEAGKDVHVYACETRPVLQGARLTSWEMQKEGIPCTLITDNMAGHLMKSREIHAFAVGADQVAANGDTANKIGTYSMAVLTRYHNVPFYVAAPTSTINLLQKDGGDIPIEQRNPVEVTRFGSQRIAPDGINALNPAFDLTPASLIAAIVTEHGIARPPFTSSLRSFCEETG